jgi:ABC-type Fe3+/spermidine/putrescine transport system ATPase subunit
MNIDIINKAEEILKEKGYYKNVYFDQNEYKIDSFLQTTEIIFNVYDMALGTMKLQGQENIELKNIVDKISNYKENEILTISIYPINYINNTIDDDYITILVNPSMSFLIGIYEKPKSIS